MKKIITIIVLLVAVTLSAQSEKKTLQVGDKAPSIKGIDQHGNKLDSDIILKNNKILLVFYRGNWCPHCKKHLTSLQEHLNEFKEKGVQVIVVTPETVEKTKETADKFKNEFSIVHDVDNKIMTDYKVAYEVNKQTVPKYYKIVQEKLNEYNVENNNVLPVPATYLIDNNGKIIYAQYDENYKNRSDFSEILNSL